MVARRLQTSQIVRPRNSLHIVKVYALALQQADRNTQPHRNCEVCTLGWRYRTAHYSAVICQLHYPEVLTTYHGGGRIARDPSDRPTPTSSAFARGSGHATAHP